MSVKDPCVVFDDLLNNLLEQIKENLRSQEGLTPCTFIERAGSPPIIAACLNSSDEDANSKHFHAAITLSLAAYIRDTTHVIHLSEAYMADMNNDKLHAEANSNDHRKIHEHIINTYGSIGESPYGIDVVILNGDSHDHIHQALFKVVDNNLLPAHEGLTSSQPKGDNVRLAFDTNFGCLLGKGVLLRQGYEHYCSELKVTSSIPDFARFAKTFCSQAFHYHLPDDFPVALATMIEQIDKHNKTHFNLN